ncbi:branched-chain amino acid transport system II carrier protein [Shewanella schlegeliana]|uniref:Branched-chain amino acid transport system carrier protein n=1 Tax=Shewanella schlegeliana TaxID=190308 RepID=A0ABS1T1P2_9GAMM|nr:branched-chain amino acid transport system II carrier protein [Shewanella schlegeliana]MBL4914712.1 branched-chain amino acid transport system II carrier protein [Shewanella schlegeliana]MCL1109956.1 branched-chain amino acid transport system II carrier protein [Shewanella schlegeliana]GIU25484.1 branched-chain amino acid transport system carrier protein [Shewanella schlegeliana]
MPKQQILYIGFMTFALFLGAGNIIFPPMLGHGAGEEFYQALSGFLLTSVGMPVLTLIAISWLGGSDAITAKLPRWAHLAFWSTLFLTIGPLFNMPRTFTVAYEFTGKPFFADSGLLLATLIFAVLTLFFALKPAQIMSRVGKLLTPTILLLILFTVCSVIAYPHGASGSTAVKYQEFAFAAGLADGYMTMDVLGAIGFGWLVINVINQNSTGQVSLTKTMVRVTLVYGTVMCLVYIAMAWIGANYAGKVSNGGELLSDYMHWIYGTPGMLCLGAIMALACLTTAVGLTCASASFFSENFKFIAYQPAAITIVAVSTIIANVGLDTLISITLPLVVILHPITICVVGLAVYFHQRQTNYQVWTATLCVSVIGGSIDAAKIVGLMPESLSEYFANHLPLYHYNASWILPTFGIFIASTLLDKQLRKRKAQQGLHSLTPS